MFKLEQWEKALYGGDSNGYYLHVVSFFVNQDIGDYDKTITSLKKVNPTSADPREDKFGVRLTDKGRRYIKYTLGVAVMETPFFLVAHAFAKWSGRYDPNGWTKPYLLAISLSTIFYVLFGMYLLIRVLINFFPTPIILLTIATVGLATNLFFHATYMTMAHGFLFFQHSLLIFLVYQFYKQPSKVLSLGIGATIGLITLTRVPEVVSGLVFLLWGVLSWKDLKERFSFLTKNYTFLLLAAVGFFVIFSLQMAYWYYVSGQFIFDPYKGEGFNFLKPNIWKGWFDFANGWLIYTPVMAFSLVGWFFLKRYCTDVKWPIFAFVLVHAWIHYSYYAWTYFPGLGSRPMIETYPLLAFGLAAFFTVLSENKSLKWIPFLIFGFFTWLNLFQTWQMEKGIIWTERGSAAFYWESFGRMNLSRDALIAFESKEAQPDTNKIDFIRNLAFNGFENPQNERLTQEIVFDGDYALISDEKSIYAKEDFDLANIRSGDWIRLGVNVYMRAEDHNYNRYNCGILKIQFINRKGQVRKTRGIRMAPFIGNETNSIWTAGKPGMWEEAHFFCKVPQWFDPESWQVRTTIWNPHHKKLVYDNLSIDLYRKQ